MIRTIPTDQKLAKEICIVLDSNRYLNPTVIGLYSILTNDLESVKFIKSCVPDRVNMLKRRLHCGIVLDNTPLLLDGSDFEYSISEFGTELSKIIVDEMILLNELVDELDHDNSVSCGYVIIHVNCQGLITIIC